MPTKNPPTTKDATPGRTARRATPQAPSLTLSDLEQVKVLADPLRIRILEELCTEERTTKQVAQRLGEKPTKLYHHVETLERVGLIRLARTRQNRGTIEKYYLAVARQFRTESRLFSAAGAGAEAESGTMQAMISTVFDRTSAEMRALVERKPGRDEIEEQGVLTYLEIRTDPAHGRRIQAQLSRLIKSLETPKSRRKSAEKKYRLTLAFYPLEPDR